MNIKVEAISQQIEELETLKGKLQDILNRWEEQPPLEAIDRTICPNIQCEWVETKQ